MSIQVRPSFFSSSAILVLAVTTALLSSTVAAHAMGRHYVAEVLASTVDVVAVPEMTMGPYFESESDYVNGSDMTAAAKAGYSSTITADRVSVTKGIPFALTLNIWNVTSGGTEVFPLVGADVFLWHCDGLGRYSAVSQSQQSEEGTTGQMWLRGKQTTSATGSVTFQTILAGWYTGRAIHYHVRVRLAGASSTSFASTTQLFLNQTFISSYSSVYPYTLDTNTMTLLVDDMHYLAASASVRTKLVMNASGSNTAGYGTTYNLGIDTSGLSASGAASTTSAATGSSVTGSVVTTNGALPPGMTSFATTTAAPPPATTSSATTTPTTTTASLTSTSTSTSSSVATGGASIATCVFVLMLLSMP